MKCMPFLHCISRDSVFLIKICKMEPPDLLLLVFFSLAFTSADIISHQFLKDHKFSFFDEFTQTIHFLND